MTALLLLRQGSAFLLLQTELRDFLGHQDEGGAANIPALRWTSEDRYVPRSIRKKNLRTD
jgi:hypothetical protein